MARPSRDGDAAVPRPDRLPAIAELLRAGQWCPQSAAALARPASDADWWGALGTGRARKMKKPPGFPGGCGSFERCQTRRNVSACIND